MQLKRREFGEACLATCSLLPATAGLWEGMASGFVWVRAIFHQLGERFSHFLGKAKQVQLVSLGISFHFWAQGIITNLIHLEIGFSKLWLLCELFIFSILLEVPALSSPRVFPVCGSVLCNNPLCFGVCSLCIDQSVKEFVTCLKKKIYVVGCRGLGQGHSRIYPGNQLSVWHCLQPCWVAGSVGILGLGSFHSLQSMLVYRKGSAGTPTWGAPDVQTTFTCWERSHCHGQQ